MSRIGATRIKALLCIALTTGVIATCARAASFKRSGTIATISGVIEDGDDFRLNALLRQPEKIKLIYLNSPGGNLYAAYKMSESIRASGLATAVDASHAICASACTAIFVGGVRRYYLNAQSIVDGSRQGRGLGFHSASDWNGGALHANQEKSDIGNGLLAYVYREMGASEANTLTGRANYTGVFWISGRTALSLNVATSLAGP
ncbi:hypothetical protein [Labrys miyagiensis]|nr:hypothetical protein [Labrys miyagiensis]